MKKELRNILLVLLCLGLIGCTVTSKGKKIEDRIMQLEESLLNKDKEIGGLRDLLREREDWLREKDAKIEELNKKLEMFGVFEK